MGILPCRRKQLATARLERAAAHSFRVTHPFHPLAGCEFPLLDERRQGEARVYFEAPEGFPGSLPEAWTSRAPIDPLAVVAAGRAHFRVDDLLRLSTLLTDLARREVSRE
jgi:hypothetical protein